MTNLLDSSDGLKTHRVSLATSMTALTQQENTMIKGKWISIVTELPTTGGLKLVLTDREMLRWYPSEVFQHVGLVDEAATNNYPTVDASEKHIPDFLLKETDVSQ